ncbi:MAG: YybH family protein [bacterium]
MKRFSTIILVLAASLFLANASMAGDVEDIKKATMEHFATQNAGDAKAHIAHHMPYHTQFAGGGLLVVSHSREEQVKSMQTGFNAGLKLNLDLAHLDVNVYGKAAVVTGYVIGTVTNPDGKTSGVRAQRTAVLIKEGGEWKEVHVHSSPITAAQ